MTLGDAGLVVVSYLLGSVSFSYWTVRRRLGQDVRALGSGNAGATNVLRVAGITPALVVFLGDFGKGIVAVTLARAVGAADAVIGAVVVAVVVGHVFPVFHGFRGGKGVATAAGAVGTTLPLAALASALAFVVIVLATRHVALGSMGAVASCPLFAVALARVGWAPEPGAALVTATALVAALIVWLHRSNIRRIRNGTEWRLGDPR